MNKINKKGLSLRKRIVLAAILIVLILGTIFLLKNKKEEERLKEIEANRERVEIELTLVPGEDTKSEILVEDEKIVKDLKSMLEEYKLGQDQLEKSELDEMSRPNNKLVFTKGNKAVETYTFSYDNLKHVGFIEKGDQKTPMSYTFFRYIEDLERYHNYDSEIDPKVRDLFGKYDWTVDYKGNTLEEKLPESLKHKAGEDPNKLYWAYVLDLSKEIGLDFTESLGSEISVEFYRLREQLPSFFTPYLNARGIVLKKNDQIIGAYIDSSEPYGYGASSLDRKSRQEASGKNWQEWLEQYIDYDDDFEKSIAQMKPEEVLDLFLEGVEENDKKKILGALSRKEMLTYIFQKQDPGQLFNDEINPLDNIEKIEVLERKILEEDDNKMNLEIIVDLKQKEEITVPNGKTILYVEMEKETDKSSWKVKSVNPVK